VQRHRFLPLGYEFGKTSTKRSGMSENQDWSFDTQQIHSGQTPDPTTIGIEDISDIIADLEKGFAAAKI
jgi:hypothetical protein